MKSKPRSGSKRGRRTSSSTPKNINLKVSPIHYNSLKPNHLSQVNLFQVNRSQVKNSSKPKVKTVAYKRNKTHQMDWKQLKQKYPKMNPYSDADFDGLVNSRDCRPLDPSKDGAFSRFIGIITGGKKGQSAAEYKAERKAKSEAKFEKKMEKDIKRAAINKVKFEKQKEKDWRKEQGQLETKQLKEHWAAKRATIKQKARGVVKSKIAEKIEKRIEQLAPHIVYKTVMKGGKKVRVAVRVPGKTILTAGQRGAIVRTVERFAGVKGAQATAKSEKRAKGVKGAGAGRPKGSYDYKDPRTGEPIPAVEYHKIRKQLKKQAKAVETQTEVKQRFALAKRGLSPEEVAAAQEEINARMARLRAIKEAKQSGAVAEATPTVASLPEEEGPEFEEQVIQQEARQIPEEVVQQAIPPSEVQVQSQQQVRQPQYQQQSQVRTSPARSAFEVPGAGAVPPGYRLHEDLMTGKKALVPLLPPEAWTR